MTVGSKMRIYKACIKYNICSEDENGNIQDEKNSRDSGNEDNQRSQLEEQVDKRTNKTGFRYSGRRKMG